MVHRKWDGLGRYLLGSGSYWLLPLVAMRNRGNGYRALWDFKGPEVLKPYKIFPAGYREKKPQQII